MQVDPPIIAIVDDEPRMRTALGRLLRGRGFGVACFSDGSALLDAQPGTAMACVLLDLHLPGPDGFEVLAALAERPGRPPVIVLTGHDQPGNAERAARLGACAYLAKPVDETPLFQAIAEALGKAPEAA